MSSLHRTEVPNRIFEGGGSGRSSSAGSELDPDYKIPLSVLHCSILVDVQKVGYLIASYLSEYDIIIS
jgi:hypothetical protein